MAQLPQLEAEREALGSGFVHAARLLQREIDRVQNGAAAAVAAAAAVITTAAATTATTAMPPVAAAPAGDEDRRYRDVVSNQNMKLCEKVLIPVKQHPKFNFVGKLLGPQGNSLKRLQAETGTKMSILGKGCMRDKAKEEELRRGGEAKYAHLQERLHVLIEVFAPPGDAYARMGHALQEVKKFLVPDYNDEIRLEQLRELTFLNGSAESPATPPRARGGAAPKGGCVHPVPPALPPAARGLGSAPRLRAALVPRGATLPGRGAVPLVRPGIGRPPHHGRPAPRVPPPPPLPPRAAAAAHVPDPYAEYAYSDGYEASYEDSAFDGYESDYASGSQSTLDYYEYETCTREEAYHTYDEEDWSETGNHMKAPAVRTPKGAYREHPYNRY
ncbi:KH domain-containing, RNA-binding, signal transduction-associated protein 2 isoform X2 [Lethenteron reissneri]|uniref:KH domain-containing, RNA-binding, signal transduction-associated protein 2 isoform X2 n=1 Tax=Lethenteron reissneri TaxID=7753 RepID=UPI002AB70070|nr:KH domain-containing, RNA-binding, signal transduction-associated protein 2 isoform X2 [Lethenteron reissneri]